MLLAGIAAQGNDGRVFEQKQCVRDTLLLTQIDQSFLELKRGAVVDEAEMEDGDHCVTTAS